MKRRHNPKGPKCTTCHLTCVASEIKNHGHNSQATRGPGTIQCQHKHNTHYTREDLDPEEVTDLLTRAVNGELERSTRLCWATEHETRDKILPNQTESKIILEGPSTFHTAGIDQLSNQASPREHSSHHHVSTVANTKSTHSPLEFPMNVSLRDTCVYRTNAWKGGTLYSTRPLTPRRAAPCPQLLFGLSTRVISACSVHMLFMGVQFP
jgi:hypothetical protein